VNLANDFASDAELRCHLLEREAFDFDEAGDKC